MFLLIIISWSREVPLLEENIGYVLKRGTEGVANLVERTTIVAPIVEIFNIFIFRVAAAISSALHLKSRTDPASFTRRSNRTKNN